MTPRSHQRRRKIIPLALVGVLASASVPNAVAATTEVEPNELEIAGAALSRHAATQGMVLLENSDSALPLARTGNVAVFGVGSYVTVKGGTGSGSVNNRYTVNVLTGLEDAGYLLTTSPGYSTPMRAAADAAVSGTTGIFGGVDYAGAEVALTPETVLPTAPTDTALFVIARNSGEFNDRRSGKGDYQLNDIERANIALLGKTYAKVIVVLNTGGIMDTSWYSAINAAAEDPAGGQPLDALLLMSQAGQESGHALVDVLTGDVAPSGKLTDTWASSYTYYPASQTFASNDGDSLHEAYTEGLYVGYRYFDSMYEKLAKNPDDVVRYPFGFGLSYTTFDIRAGKVEADSDTVTVRAKVTNTGTSAGAEVVQVYVSAPQKGLDKPYQELEGFAKTDVLDPGQSQEVTIEFKLAELASYSESRASWVLEGGDYIIRVGNSSRSTHVATKLNVSSTVITERLSNQLDGATFDELTSNPANFYSYEGEATEIAAAQTVNLNAASVKTVNNASDRAQRIQVPTTSPLYPIDGTLVSSTTALIDPAQTDWSGSGAPYVAKEGEKIKHVQTDPGATLYDVAKGELTMEQFVAGLSNEQLANIVEGAGTTGSTLMLATGSGGYTTSRYENLGIPGLGLQDGPAGLRLTQSSTSRGVTTYQWATAFPIGTMLAQTFDPDLITEVGEAIGKEMAEYGTTLWLAPSLNIHRDPLNGRNFEYYSEDPFVSGIASVATTLGIQKTPGRGVAIKHYAANNQETTRTTSDSQISERTLREIYLKGFEMSVKGAAPMSVMTSYNYVNGTYAAANYDLIEDVLRGEWGFEGLVMTDWGAGPRAGAPAVMYAGNDLIMPGNNPTEVVTAVQKLNVDIDGSGLPVYISRTTASNGRTSYTWQWGSFSPSATGTETVSTVVNSTSDLTALKSQFVDVDVINNETVTAHPGFASVDAAYTEVTTLLGGSALTAAQRAAITVTDVVRQDPADTASPVVSYTVNVRGGYPARGVAMRLGDLQRSAVNILTVISQSAPFEQLAETQGVDGISVAPYADQFDLTRFLDSQVGEPTTEPTPKPTPTPTPTPKPTQSATPWTPSAPYTIPGTHQINGRTWLTTCSRYSQTERCRTEIWASTVARDASGRFSMKQGWAFNNQTYLPYMTRAQWAKNPLGHAGEWRATDGRQWRTECDTAATGRGACRSYTMTTVYKATPKAGGGYTFSQQNEWVFNNIVMFRR